MSADATIRTIADQQLHMVTTKQLLAAGLTRRQIQTRVENGRLRPLHRGVYLAAGTSSCFEQRSLAACLAAGPDAFASHRTAAKIWALIDDAPERIDITVPSGRRVRLPGINVHSTNGLRASDKGTRDAIPISGPARTLLEIASLVPITVLRRAADRAFRRDITTPQRMKEYLSRAELARFAGIAEIRSVVNDRLTNGVPESELESLTVDLFERFRLPSVKRQYWATTGGRRVRFDFAYPDSLLAIEVEGTDPHLDPERWESDHFRFNATTIGDWRVLRFTWKQIVFQPLYVAMTIAEALSLLPTGWRRCKVTKAAPCRAVRGVFA